MVTILTKLSSFCTIIGGAFVTLRRYLLPAQGRHISAYYRGELS
jgi:hypothetical protein